MTSHQAKYEKDAYHNNNNSNSSVELKNFIVELLQEKNARDVVVTEMHNSSITDFIIFASGRSVKNIKAIAEYISLELKHKLHRTTAIEGMLGSDWVLLDTGEIVVHLLHPNTRQELQIEALYM